MEDVAGIPSALSDIYTTQHNCIAQDYATSTTDVMLEQKIQSGHPWEFPNLKAFCVVYPYTIFKYFSNIII